MSEATQDVGDFEWVQEQPAWKDHWPEFETVLKAKLQAGHEEYGDGSFELSLHQLADEVEQEVVDIVGWSFIQWTRIQRLKRMIAKLESNPRE